MKPFLKIAFFACLIFSLSYIASYGLSIGKGIGGLADTPPAPRLLSPIGETVDLSGSGHLEFSWTKDYIAVADHYDFRLYKGYKTYTQNLIHKQQLPAAETSLVISASEFQNGQVYTWGLRQISLGGERSDWAYSSFKAIK